MADFDPALFPDYRQIRLSKGYYAIVDAENYQWLMQWRWFALIGRTTVYAVRDGLRANKKPTKMILMHRQIMETPSGMMTNHRDRNGLMNIVDNLRICKNAQNQHNRRNEIDSLSMYKGVYLDKRNKKWFAQMKAGDRVRFIGRFVNEHEAALAYDRAAIKYIGEYARVNFVHNNRPS